MDPTLYRQYIRAVILLDAPYACPDVALQDGVECLAGKGRFDVSVFRDAVEWNLSKDYIRSAVNPDTDKKEWRLTPLGKAKQDSE